MVTFLNILQVLKGGSKIFAVMYVYFHVLGLILHFVKIIISGFILSAYLSAYSVPLHSMKKQPKERPAPNNLMVSVSPFSIWLYDVFRAAALWQICNVKSIFIKND